MLCVLLVYWDPARYIQTSQGKGFLSAEERILRVRKAFYIVSHLLCNALALPFYVPIVKDSRDFRQIAVHILCAAVAYYDAGGILKRNKSDVHNDLIFYA